MSLHGQNIVIDEIITYFYCSWRVPDFQKIWVCKCTRPSKRNATPKKT